MQSSDTSNQTTDHSYNIPADPHNGKNIKLTLNIDTQVPGNEERISEFESVAASEPQSIQDFLIRLNELQKQKAAIKK